MSAQKPTAQPILESLPKSFEPTAIEARWGPAWEAAGLGRAGCRGTGQPDAEAAAWAAFKIDNRIGKRREAGAFQHGVGDLDLPAIRLVVVLGHVEEPAVVRFALDLAPEHGRAALVRSGSCTLAVGSPYGIRRLSRAETYALRETRSASARSRFA